MTSVPSGKCGPCCSVAASGNTAIQRAGSAAGDVGPVDVGPVAGRNGRSHRAKRFFGWICKVVCWSFRDDLARRRDPRPRGRDPRPSPPIMGQNDRRSPTMNPAFLPRALTAALLALAWPRWRPRARRPSTRSRLEPTGSPRPSMADSSRRSPTAPTRNTASTSPSCPAAPTSNNRMLLIAGKLDFFMSANTLQSFDAVANNVPLVAVAAIFQKDPQVFLTHPEVKIGKLEDLKPLTLFVSKEGDRELFPVAEVRIWLQREQGQALHLQLAALHREQAKRDAGLCHLRTLRGRKGRRIQAEGRAAGRLRLQRLFDPDRDPRRDRRQEARPGAALRRCVHDRLVQLSLRRQRAGQCDDQEAQSGNDRRTAEIFDRPR